MRFQFLTRGLLKEAKRLQISFFLQAKLFVRYWSLCPFSSLLFNSIPQSPYVLSYHVIHLLCCIGATQLSQSYNCLFIDRSYGMFIFVSREYPKLSHDAVVSNSITQFRYVFFSCCYHILVIGQLLDSDGSVLYTRCFS